MGAEKARIFVKNRHGISVGHSRTHLRREEHGHGEGTHICEEHTRYLCRSQSNSSEARGIHV
jgi:hypothetical protein